MTFTKFKTKWEGVIKDNPARVLKSDYSAVKSVHIGGGLVEKN